jgi:hypothetical protein
MLDASRAWVKNESKTTMETEEGKVGRTIRGEAGLVKDFASLWDRRDVSGHVNATAPGVVENLPVGAFRESRVIV